MGKGYESEKFTQIGVRPPGTFSVNASAGVADEEQVQGIKAVALTCLFAIFLPGVYYLATWTFHLFSFLNERIQDKMLLGQLAAGSTLFVGIGLYVLRERRRMIYATLEIAFAVVTAALAVSKVKTQGDLGVWIAIAASAYLVVRGMENLQKSGITFGKTWNKFLTSPLIVRKRKD